MPAVWTGYISFGLVNIPVRALAAREDRDVHLEGLHAPCGSPASSSTNNHASDTGGHAASSAVQSSSSRRSAACPGNSASTTAQKRAE